MKAELRLPKHQLARIWVNELPNGTSFPVADVLRRTVITGRTKSNPTQAVAVEWSVPLGPFTAYGLLSARLATSAETGMKLEVMTSGREGLRYEEALASKVSEDARVGLPVEYGDAVLVSLGDTLERRGCSMLGKLVVDHAAHGLVGSSPEMFARLAGVLGELLCSEKEPDQRRFEELLVWK